MARYLSSRSGRACLGSYIYFRAVYVDILVAYSKCDAVVSFPGCIYLGFFVMRTNEFSSHRAAREKCQLDSLLLEQFDE